MSMSMNFHTGFMTFNYVSSSLSGMTSEIAAIDLGPLSIYSTATNITVSWAVHVPQLHSTSYTLTSVCTLLCNGTPFLHATSTVRPTDTSATITGLFPGSFCNISLSGYNGIDSYLPTIASATSKSESESLATALVIPVFGSMPKIWVTVKLETNALM